MGLLRLLLALSVVVVHTKPIFGYTITMDTEWGATVAVQTFFIISGFYMALILNEKYTGRGAYGLFISNRLLRLFPAYWAVLLLTLAGSVGFYFLFGYWGWLNYFVQNYHLLNSKAVIFLIGANIIMLGQDLAFLLGLDQVTGSFYFAKYYYFTKPELRNCLLIPQAWSISLELMFYLLAPFLVRKNIYVLLAVIVPSLLLRVFISENLVCLMTLG